MKKVAFWWMSVAFVLVGIVACGGSEGPVAADLPPAPDEKASQAGEDAELPDDVPDEVLPLSSLEEAGLAVEWTGDLDGMIERGYLRALVSYSETQYFLDGARQRGIAYEALVEFEKFLNQRLGSRHVRVEVVILPVRRDELLPALEGGLGDLAAANLTITPERQKVVDFSIPGAKNVHEVVVTGPGAPAIETLDDLAGRTVHLRRSSSYWSSVEALNRGFADRGLQPIELRPAEEHLEDEALLELVNAGMLPWVVVDEHKARFWADVMDDLTVRDDLAVRTGGSIGWAFRKDSPQLAEVVNDFIRQHRQGTLYGNVILKRYLESNPWVRNNLETSEQRKVEQVLPLFLKYGEMYDFPPVILMAMGYQESQLDQSKRSRAGAVGVMQIKPSTAADRNVGITGVDEVENNIHAATKYLAFLRDRYFSDPEITDFNRVFLTLAAYNAGPARVRQLRNEAAADGLDPNVWFGEVEQVAARRIGRETVHYVSNIAKYAFAYRLVYGERLRDLAAE